ncbi:MAG: hypothetical protein M0T79_09775 [Actinomycetota bacterium]|nr:hypothetical protein [Actinomycetota bacterium]
MKDRPVVLFLISITVSVALLVVGLGPLSAIGDDPTGTLAATAVFAALTVATGARIVVLLRRHPAASRQDTP